MRSEEWQKVEKLLDAALELPPEERHKFLDERAASAPELRREVESLLTCEEQTGGFLGAPAMAFSADFFDDREERAGQTISHYRIIREIGRGGMGAVFLAARADGAFRQQVALKIIRQSFADSELERRFQRERQILASLNHPNIARLLDGGVSASGEPFLVMEYIEGEPLPDFAERRNLSIKERLRLFLKVCAAVQYAHRNLIVHRDIKPANILVTTDGEPKLLDFGLAKILDAGFSESDLTKTATEFRAFTPAYASPEQVRGKNITTASDVYSLGVVLYELLTGERPFQIEHKSYEEIVRLIDTTEAPRPSGAVTRNGAAAGGADRPHSTRHFLSASELKGDLDNIVLMALRKEPERRYKSVEQFAEDISRQLEGLPVIAHKDTFGYRSTKFIRRHKAGIAAAVLVALALVGGIIATAWQARRATREAQIAAQERDRARLEAAKAERINAFLQSIFASANPSWYSTGFGQRGEVKVVDVLEQAGRRIDTDFKDQPEIRAELHHTIGTTYQSLGRFESARAHFRASVDAYRGLYGERHPEVAEALYYLAASMQGSGDHAAALALYRQSLEMFREVDPQNVNVPYLLSDFSYLLTLTGELAAAEQAAREGLELARRRFGDEHVLTTNLLTGLGMMYETRGDLAQAETFHQTALATFNRMPNGRMLSSGTLTQLGRLAMLRGDLRQAEAQARESLDITRQIFNETHPHNLEGLLLIAEIHYQQGAYADAEKETVSFLDLMRRNEALSLNYKLAGLNLMSLIHAKTNRPASANAYLREALALFNSMPDEIRHHDDGLLGEALILMERETEARALLSKRYEYLARKYGEQTPGAVRTRRQLEQLGAATRTP